MEAIGSGKIYHGQFVDPESWNDYWLSKTQDRPPDPKPENFPLNGIQKTAQFDWGPANAYKEEMSDWKVADWVISQIQQKHEKPLFLACGFFRPHLPRYVPPQYFDMYPLENITLPEVNENDLDDIPSGVGK